MAQIRIHLDGTFESLSAKSLSPAEKRAEIKRLQADLKTISQVEKLRVAREAAKTAKNTAKDKELLVKIKALKAQLSSNRNSSSEKVKGYIKAVMDQPTGTGKTIAKLDKESKPGKAPAASPVKKAPAAKKEATTDNRSTLKAAGIKLSALNAADKANVKKLAAMKDHQEMANAVRLGEIDRGKPTAATKLLDKMSAKLSPRGMGASGTVRNAGKLIATHLKPEDRAKIDKISKEHETVLNKIRNTPGSHLREQDLNARTQKKLNASRVFQAHFDHPWTVINLINGITSVKSDAAKK
jgi:hypothetical protein